MELNTINVFGDLYRYSGYGYLVRETVRALRKFVKIRTINMFSDKFGHIGEFPDLPSEKPLGGAPDLFIVPPIYAQKSSNGFLYTMVEAYPAPRVWCRAAMAANTKAVMTTSDFCKTALVDGGIDVSVTNVFNVFDPAGLLAPPKCDENCYFRSLEPYAIYSGSILKRKGVDLYPPLARLCPNIKFVLKLNLVDGICVPLGRETIDAPNVNLMVGTMSRLQLAHLYSHALSGVYLARCDTISKFPMELAYYGKPCITGMHSGLAEWTPPDQGVKSVPVLAEEVYDGLTWWEPDINEAAEKLQKLLSGPASKYDRMADLEKFAPDVVAKRILTVIGENS